MFVLVCLFVVLSPPQIKEKKKKKKGNAPGFNSTAQDGVGVKAHFCNLTQSLHYYILPKQFQLCSTFVILCFLMQLLFCSHDPDCHYHRVQWDIMIRAFQIDCNRRHSWQTGWSIFIWTTLITHFLFLPLREPHLTAPFPTLLGQLLHSTCFKPNSYPTNLHLLLSSTYDAWIKFDVLCFIS